jgi:hypothetical protein
MKKLLPTPSQARNMLVLGLVAVLASQILREELSGTVLAVGCGLVLAGLVFNGFSSLLASLGKSTGASQDGSA